MDSNNLYLKEQQRKILEEKKKELENKVGELVFQIEAIIGSDESTNQEYRSLIEKIEAGTENGEMFSFSRILREMQGIDSDNLRKLDSITHDLAKVSDIVRNIKAAIVLPSKETLQETVKEERRKTVIEAKEREVANPTDLSRFTTLVDYPLDDTREPYARLCLFIEALPYSLDPTDPRYISLTRDDMLYAKDAKFFNTELPGTEMLNGQDIICELRSWSDTFTASKQMRRLSAFQQYLEGDMDEFEKSIADLQSGRIPENCDKIREAAEDISKEENAMQKSYKLAAFYKKLESQYGRYDLRADIGLFINTKFDRDVTFFPRIDLPVMTEVEQAFMKIESERFEEESIRKVYGITPYGVDQIAKEYCKMPDEIGE